MNHPATLTVVYEMNNGAHATQHISTDASNWDAALMRCRDILRSKVADGIPVIAAELRMDARSAEGASLGKVYQPNEWAVPANA